CSSYRVHRVSWASSSASAAGRSATPAVRPLRRASITRSPRATRGAGVSMAVPSSRSGDPESGTAGAGVSCRHASACGARTARIRRCSGRSVGAGSEPGAELAREPLEALEARTVEADDAHLLVAGGVLRLHRIEGGDGRGVPDVGLGEVDDHRRGVAGVVELVDEIVAGGPEQLAP